MLTIEQAELHIPRTYLLKLCEKANYLGAVMACAEFQPLSFTLRFRDILIKGLGDRNRWNRVQSVVTGRTRNPRSVSLAICVAGKKGVALQVGTPR